MTIVIETHSWAGFKRLRGFSKRTVILGWLTVTRMAQTWDQYVEAVQAEAWLRFRCNLTGGRKR